MMMHQTSPMQGQFRGNQLNQVIALPIKESRFQDKAVGIIRTMMKAVWGFFTWG